MLMALRGILVSLLGVYYFTFFKDYNNVKKSNKLDKLTIVFPLFITNLIYLVQCILFLYKYLQHLHYTN